jgi:hypothetical protein
MDIRKIIQSQSTQTREPQTNGMFKDFEATELYCQKCRQAVAVRKRLLLVLPEGDKYEYLCAYCASPVGTKIERNQKPLTVIV